MISIAIPSRRMHENRQPFTVEHQPRYDLAKILQGKHGLIHRLEMRTNRLVVPASKLHSKARPQPFTHACRRIFRVRIVIAMGVVAPDFPLAHKPPLRLTIAFFLSTSSEEAKRQLDSGKKVAVKAVRGESLAVIQNNWKMNNRCTETIPHIRCWRCWQTGRWAARGITALARAIVSR